MFEFDVPTYVPKFEYYYIVSLSRATKQLPYHSDLILFDFRLNELGSYLIINPDSTNYPKNLTCIKFKKKIGGQAPRPPI